MARFLQVCPTATLPAYFWVLGIGTLPGCSGCGEQGDVLPTSDLLELAGCEETTVYLDQDGDGYGDPTTAMRSCTAPASVVGNDLDCNDADSALSPDAEAVCADNLDNDCDGEPDCPSLDRRTGLDEATASMVDLYQSSSGYGMAITDITGDDVMDLLIGSPDAEEGDYRGRVRLVVGPVSGQIDLTSDDVPDISSETDNEEGAYLASGDLDGDTYADLVLGVISSSREENGVYIVPGPVQEEYHIDHDGATYLNLDFSDMDSGGRSEVMTGDLFGGDGQIDLLLDVRRPNAGAGSAYLLRGPIGEDGSILDVAETALHAPSDEEEDGINNVDIVGDINGDGVADVAGMDDGILHLIFDLPPGNLSIADVAAVTIEADYDGLGYLFGNPGDVDGDGLDDLLTTHCDPGDVYWTSSGSVYLFTSDTLNAAADGPMIDDNESVTAIFDGGDYSQIGMGLASPGDLNEDGYSDVFIGDPEAAGGDSDHYEGRASLWYGPVEGTVTPGQADILIRGDEVGSRTGWRVAASPRDAQNNAILLVGTWPVFGDSTLYQFTPDGY